MEDLIIEAVTSDLKLSTEVQFKVKFGKKNWQQLGHSGRIKIPTSSPLSPLTIYIVAQPTVSHFYEVEAQYRYTGNGKFKAIQQPLGLVQPPKPTVAKKGTLKKYKTTILFYLSRVKDVYDLFIQNYNSYVDAETQHMSPAEKASKRSFFKSLWSIPSGTADFIKNPPFEHSALQFEQATCSPSIKNFVFEYKEKDVPKLIYAGWPTDLATKYRQTPIWMFWRPGMYQNYTFQGTYPHSWDYYFRCFLVNLLFFGKTPRTHPTLKGLLYQLHHAGKDALVIMPMPRQYNKSQDPEFRNLTLKERKAKREDFGSFMQADTAQTVIEEIIGYCQRVHHNYVKPQIGYTVFSSFSSGNNKLNMFLKKNNSSEFLSKYIKEVIAIDPPRNRHTQNVMSSIRAWQNNKSDRIGRVYTYKAYPFFKSFLGYGIASRLGLYKDASGNRSIMISPKKKWVDAFLGDRMQYSDFAIRHHGHCSVMHTDALRRSKLPNK